MNSRLWPDIFWWILAPLGIPSILVFCFVEEAGLASGEDETYYPDLPLQFLANRARTLWFGTFVVPKILPTALVDPYTADNEHRAG